MSVAAPHETNCGLKSPGTRGLCGGLQVSNPVFRFPRSFAFRFYKPTQPLPSVCLAKRGRLEIDAWGLDCIEALPDGAGDGSTKWHSVSGAGKPEWWCGLASSCHAKGPIVGGHPLEGSEFICRTSSDCKDTETFPFWSALYRNTLRKRTLRSGIAATRLQPRRPTRLCWIRRVEETYLLKRMQTLHTMHKQHVKDCMKAQNCKSPKRHLSHQASTLSSANVSRNSLLSGVSNSRVASQL